MALAVLTAAVVAGFASGCGGSATAQSTTPQTAGVAGAQATKVATTPTPASALALQQRFQQIVKTVGPQVVQIETGQGLGSGVVYDDKGDVVTNAHVVGSAKTFTVTLANGDRVRASLVGTFPPDDLAVVHLEKGTPAPARWGSTHDLKVGDIVLAIGNPLGLRSSVTDGIVSSLGRTVSEGNGVALASVIQTSAAINPGNSGGALVDLEGRVVGIPTLAALDPQLGGGAAPGIGFAIPGDTVKKIADQLIATGHVSQSGRAYLGVQVATPLTGGVIVAGVVKGGPAASADLKVGDRIVSVQGKTVGSTDDLAAVLATIKPGTKVPVVVTRGGARHTVEVTLGQLKSP